LRFKLAGMIGELRSVATSEVEALIAAADDVRYRVVLLLATEAGLRAGEIRGLQWTDIKSGQLTVRRALDKMTNASIAPKHNKTRTIPLSRRLAAEMAKLVRHGLWVISEPDGSSVTYDRLSKTIKAIYERAEVTKPPKPIHCLRHTFGTVMAARVALPVLRDLMGHADVQTTLRYVDIGEQQKRDAIAAVFGANVTEEATDLGGVAANETSGATALGADLAAMDVVAKTSGDAALGARDAATKTTDAAALAGPKARPVAALTARVLANETPVAVVRVAATFGTRATAKHTSWAASGQQNLAAGVAVT
jgi:hypothetical protein